MSWDLNSLAMAAAGGLMIGASAGLFYLLEGRIAGISGMFGRVLHLRPGVWRWAFLAGLIGAGAVARLAGYQPPEALAATPLGVLVAAGLLVGVGVTLANGCTSGHGVCGLARFSPRSLVSVLVFMGVAAATVFVARHAGIAP